MKYREIRRTTMSDLRLLAIKEEWFTMADNEEYEKYLKYGKKNKLTCADISNMADIVLEYSDVDYGKFETMYKIGNSLITYYEEII